VLPSVGIVALPEPPNHIERLAGLYTSLPSFPSIADHGRVKTLQPPGPQEFFERPAKSGDGNSICVDYLAPAIGHHDAAWNLIKNPPIGRACPGERLARTSLRSIGFASCLVHLN
jgi:hypothetical protein